MAELRIGTSGWHYDHWRGPFYPDDLPAEDYLGFYAERFDTVEVNHSFYRLPEPSAVETWRETVPGGFRFAVKASRYLTHMKKLKDAEGSLNRFVERVTPLGERLGPLLFQLPPKWHADLDRLAAFLELVPERVRAVFEFRDPSWHCDELYELLDRRGAAFCIYDLAGTVSPRVVTGMLAYVRLHGSGAAFEGGYTKEMLSGWAGACSAWLRGGRDVYVYFDNDARAHAPQDARRLKEMLHQA